MYNAAGQSRGGVRDHHPGSHWAPWHHQESSSCLFIIYHLMINILLPLWGALYVTMEVVWDNSPTSPSSSSSTSPSCCRCSGTTRSTVDACHCSPSPTSPPGSDSSSVLRSSFSLLSGLPPCFPFFAFFLFSPVSHCHCDCCDQETTGSRGNNGLCEVRSLPPPPCSSCSSCSSCSYFFSYWGACRGLSLRGPSDLVWGLSDLFISIPESCDQIKRCVLKHCENLLSYLGFYLHQHFRFSEKFQIFRQLSGFVLLVVVVVLLLRKSNAHTHILDSCEFALGGVKNVTNGRTNKAWE